MFEACAVVFFFFSLMAWLRWTINSFIFAILAQLPSTEFKEIFNNHCIALTRRMNCFIQNLLNKSHFRVTFIQSNSFGNF